MKSNFNASSFIQIFNSCNVVDVEIQIFITWPFSLWPSQYIFSTLLPRPGMHYGNQYQWAVFKIITHLIKFSVSIFGCWLFSLVADKIKGLHGVWLCTRNTSISMDCIGTHQKMYYKYTNTCKYTNTKLSVIPISKVLLYRNTGQNQSQSYF